MDITSIITTAIIFILPAYIANSSAALFGYGKPIDLGKMWHGKRIFGDGKTYKGFFIGILFGTVAGSVIGYATQGSQYYLGNIEFYTALGFLTSLGAMTGDLVASFFKRRLGMKRGQAFPIVDQLDFVVGALILGSIIYKLPLESIIFLLIVTPILHLLFNIIGYLLKLKKVPW